LVDVGVNDDDVVEVVVWLVEVFVVVGVVMVGCVVLCELCFDVCVIVLSCMLLFVLSVDGVVDEFLCLCLGVIVLGFFVVVVVGFVVWYGYLVVDGVLEVVVVCGLCVVVVLDGIGVWCVVEEYFLVVGFVEVWFLVGCSGL